MTTCSYCHSHSGTFCSRPHALVKSLWDIVYSHNTILAAQRSCEADAAQQRSRAVVSLSDRLNCSGSPCRLSGRFRPKRFVPSTVLPNLSTFLAAVSLQLFPSTRALSSAAMHAYARAAVLRLCAVKLQFHATFTIAGCLLLRQATQSRSRLCQANSG